MGDMAVGHDHVVVADDGLAARLHRRPMNRDVLANLVAVTDDQGWWAPPCSGCPGRPADDGKGADGV